MRETRIFKSWSTPSLALAATLACLASIGGIHAATINVPGDQTTIQAAASAMNAGDTVNLTAANYVESATFATTGILTSSQNPLPIIDGNIRIVVAGNPFTLSNIQVQNTLGSAVTIFETTGSAILVDNCILSQNASHGVTIDASTSGITIRNSVLNDNQGRGVLVDGSGPTTGSTVTIDNCDILRNSKSATTSSSTRGRGVEVVDVQHTDIIINNCDIAATEEGASDRAIQYDDGDLDFTTLTITNTHISAPLWDPMTLMGNNQGIGVKTRAKNTTFSMTNCTVNGFRHCAEWKGNFTPGNVYLTNCIFQNFNNGRGNHIQEFTDGEVIITDCSYIGSPGNKPDGGDEALRIQNSTNMEVTIDGLQTGNSEEAVTCDQDHRTTFLINDAHILAMSGEAEQGFKILESTDASWRITNSSIHGFQSGIECFNGNTGSGGTPSEPRHIRNSSITFSNSLFENNQRAIRVQGAAASSGPNTLTVTGTVILRSSFTGQFTAVSFEDTASPGGSALFRNCTFHDNNQNGVTNTAGSAYPITIDYCVFSEWGVNALSQASTGVAMSENFNVFVDLSSSAQFGGAQAAAIVHGGGSLAASALEDVYCDQDPLSLTYLFIRADGMAAAIDGAKNAGAKDTCFVTTDVENWSLYR